METDPTYMLRLRCTSCGVIEANLAGLNDVASSPQNGLWMLRPWDAVTTLVCSCPQYHSKLVDVDKLTPFGIK